MNETAAGDASTSARHFLFGTDELAGDREIAFFITEALATLTSTTTITPLATATDSGSTNAAETKLDLSSQVGDSQMKINGSRPSIPPWLRVTIRAVPLHAGDPERRYNPYHLRIVGREQSSDGASNSLDSGGGRNRSQMGPEIGGGCNNEGGSEFVRFHMESNLRGDEDGYAERVNEGEWALGFEGEGGGPSRVGKGIGGEGKGGEEVPVQMEIVSFCAEGVIHRNSHGEVHFLTLEDWSLEKKRFDAMSRMRVCSR